ncbi:uncharacterized protein LOC111695487 [Eurytemora carolleeae]|uniref:uncharacterized protein LOC111695487 n=1 Tax=Eurytemora carolleeae TaxID=1294199 RepID=UPI000C761DA5|nr:uncharacterized protein LOC111695487 [Eurytemora carolleeae]|eukprot:XP_023320603.1 uncharacterized protein LOC111695487 [Eurytemora affinis]
MYERDEEGMEEFINSTVGKSGLPTRKDFEKREARKRDIARIKKLKVSDFLKEYENPMEHFNSTAKPVTDSYKASCKKYLRKKFSSSQSQDVIDRELKDKNYHFLPTYKCLEYLPSTRKGKRGGRPGQEEDDVEGWDPGFLKEYIFLKLENKIQEAFSRAEENRTRRIQEAKRNGGLFTCACCFDDECLITEVFMCQSDLLDHMFCGLCIRRGSEVQIGDGRTRIICFQEQCDNEIEMQVLKQVLKGKVYEKLMEKRQAEDVVNAKIQDLVQCPHCTYAVIMPDNEKLIRCGNPDCAKVSCRLCKEENHLPLRCDEVEKDEEVKARTKLENQMTEAMVRICHKCKKRFFKTEGCNLMHCDCGATMCYLCRKPVPDNYTHFYGIGASPKPNLCPLYSDNDNLHKAEVLKAAKSGKVGLEGKLKNDPTLNIDQPPPNYDPNKIYARGGYQHGDEYSDDEEDGNEEEENVEEEDSEDEEGGEDDYYIRRHQPFYNLEEYDGGNEYAVQAALHDLDEEDVDEEDVDEEDLDEEDLDEEDREDVEYFELYDGANEMPEDDFQSPAHDDHYYSNRKHHSDSEQYSEGDAEQMDGIVVGNNNDGDVSDEDVDDIDDEDVDNEDVDDEDLFGEDVNDEDVDAEFVDNEDVEDEDLYGEDLNEKDVDEEDVNEEDVDVEEGHTSQYEEYDDHTDAFNEDFDEDHDDNGYDCDDHDYFEI